MDCLDCITKIRKGQHLSYEERVIIELRLKESWNVNKIAKELNRSYNTIKKEIRINQYSGSFLGVFWLIVIS